MFRRYLLPPRPYWRIRTISPSTPASALSGMTLAFRSLLVPPPGSRAASCSVSGVGTQGYFLFHLYYSRPSTRSPELITSYMDSGCSRRYDAFVFHPCIQQLQLGVNMAEQAVSLGIREKIVANQVATAWPSKYKLRFNTASCTTCIPTTLSSRMGGTLEVWYWVRGSSCSDIFSVEASLDTTRPCGIPATHRGIVVRILWPGSHPCATPVQDPTITSSGSSK